MNGYMIGNLGRDELEKLQLRLLKKQLGYVYSRSRFYKRRFDEAGIKPDDIKTLRDLERIPLTSKADLREQNNDFVCVSNEEVVDIGSSTGTTGEPVILPVTINDWNFLKEINVRTLTMVGITKEDIVQLTLAFDQLFSVSTPLDDALKEIGATVVRTGPGNSGRQIELMKKLGSTVIYASPEYMFNLADTANELGYDPKSDFKLEKGVFVGQPLWGAGWKPTKLRRKIEDTWGIEVFSDYGSMEMLAGFHECLKHNGHHTHSDYHILEVIDPSTGEALSSGEEGELVFTHLGMEGIPLVRFRQGDITSIETDECSCGGTNPRIMAIIGRTDDMLKIKGTSVYPQQIEHVLLGIPGIKSYVIEAFTEGLGDNIRIKVAFNGDKEVIAGRIREIMKSSIRMTPLIEILPDEEIRGMWFMNGTRKPKKFWDFREK